MNLFDRALENDLKGKALLVLLLIPMLAVFTFDVLKLIMVSIKDSFKRKGLRC